MRILIANDDGIYSPGIATLARVAKRFGDVRVVAPDVEQSSAGHAITSSKPLTYRRTKVIDGIESYRVNGTPADCVALGAYNWDKVDVVLSGINLGPNLGNATGTRDPRRGQAGRAARLPRDRAEHAGRRRGPDVSYLEPHVERVLELLLPDESLRLVNVNFPPKPTEIRWTRPAVEQYDGKVIPSTDPGAGRSTGSPSSRSRSTPRAPTCGRSSTATCRSRRWSSISRITTRGGAQARVPDPTGEKLAAEVR